MICIKSLFDTPAEIVNHCYLSTTESVIEIILAMLRLGRQNNENLPGHHSYIKVRKSLHEERNTNKGHISGHQLKHPMDGL